MKCISKHVNIGVATAIVAYWSMGAAPANAAQCGDFSTTNIGNPVSSIVGNNGWGLSGSEQICLNVTASNGNFSVASSNVTATNISSYPNILKGQSYGEATSGSGFPIQASAVTSMPVTWNIGGTTASGTWDAAIELWATTYNPGNPTHVNQADGTELMVWLNAQNTTPGGLTPIGQMATGGVLWDVRASRWGSGTPLWNYVAYFPANGNMQNSINTDFEAFILDTEYRNGGANGGCQNGTSGAGQCLYPSWYFTSIQAGFEMGNGGVGLSSSNFSATVNPASPPVPLYGQTAITGDTNGNLDLIYPEYDGSLKIDTLCYYGTTCTPGTWSGESALGNTHAKEVVAQVDEGGQINLVYNDPTTFALKRNVQCSTCTGGWAGESTLAGNGKQLTSIQYQGVAIQVFYADASTSALKYFTQCWTAGCTNGWSNTAQTVGTAKAKAIATVSDGNSNAYVFYADPTTSALKYNVECPTCSTAWQGEKTVGSATAKQIAAGYDFTSGNIVVFFTNPSTNAVSYSSPCSTCSGGWSTPAALPGTTAAKQLSAFYDGNGKIELVYVGTDNLVHPYIQTTAGVLTSWTALSTLQSPFRDVELAMDPTGSLILAGAGIDGSLQYAQPTGLDMPFGSPQYATGPYTSGRAYVGSP